MRLCGADVHGWYCTRERGHKDDHLATIGTYEPENFRQMILASRGQLEESRTPNAEAGARPPATPVGAQNSFSSSVGGPAGSIRARHYGTYDDPPHVREDYREVWRSGWRAGREAAEALSPQPSKESEVAIAERIARQAHEGQKDTVTGAPYITHVERVVAMVGTEQARAVAWLHDVLEDSDFTSAELRRAGISEAVLDAVELLTKPDNETSMVIHTYAQYIDRIANSGNTLALLVKLADLRDHLHANCPARLIDRYEKAWKTLTKGMPLPGEAAALSPQPDSDSVKP